MLDPKAKDAAPKFVTAQFLNHVAAEISQMKYYSKYTYWISSPAYKYKDQHYVTAAVLFSNGTWLEPEYTQDGEREWERDYEKNVLERLDPDEFITIVDCHI